ncbi:DUF5687 family protein [Zobellia barbeyronii]|uniref:ABC-2 type transport system permease protein n=1 Tax=Zobellia barbeyronii TaxID=2748009 RepID=A0ABS5WAD0_9FLAO|nr:DUF5687 family protein [Zobellia barbeyronii]MBT2160366.1 hypothetical protein [Zobellia barbeyronii]
MFKSFSKLQWKSFFRSSSMGKSIGIKIVMGFFALYFLGMLAFVGSSLFFVLEKAIPNTDPLAIISQYLLYWVLAELFIRYFMQKLPVMDIKPFLILPIKKSSIAHYILGRSAVSFYNFLALFFFIPFAIVLLIKGYAFLNVSFWLLAMIGIVLSINYINFIVNKSDKALISIASLLVACYSLEYFEILPIKEYAGNIFYALYANPLYAIIPLAIAGLSYYFNYSFIRNRIFLDASLKKKATEATSSDLSWTKRFGDIAPFLQLDLKLIWRNKRTKTQVFVSLAFAFYGLFVYGMEDMGMGSGMFVLVGILMTGVFLMNFGQFIPAWDSSYYSMMMSQNIPLKKYLEAKAALIYVSIGVMFLLSVPYVYYGWDSLAINFSCALYNLGVNVPLILFFGSKNKKRIDLNKSALGNMQGTSATQFLVALPLFGLPMLIYGPLAFFVSSEVALIALCVFGVVGFALRDKLLDFITNAYRKKKYGMIAGFKEQNS